MSTATIPDLRCKGCGRRITEQEYTTGAYTVLSWKTKRWGEKSVHKPDNVLCRECKADYNPKAKRPKFQEEETMSEEQPSLSAKEIAQKLVPVITKEPHSSKTLAKLAGIEDEDPEQIKYVLGKLRDAGKLVREDNGWWRRV